MKDMEVGRLWQEVYPVSGRLTKPQQDTINLICKLVEERAIYIWITDDPDRSGTIPSVIWPYRQAIGQFRIPKEHLSFFRERLDLRGS